MSSDQTQQQTPDQLKSSEELSLKPKAPPLEVAGYTIDVLLGSGAYGEVWSALDQKTGRRVAIKYYTRQTSLDFSLLSREVEKLVFLSADRYVVQLLDVGWDAKPPYYVMDYIDNGSLEDELNRRTTLPVDEAVELAEEICIGLMHLHGKGILHCDLKPGNVLLDQDKKPRLADFGQSRLSHEQAPALGTLFFMAPEQADLKAVPDAKWDVYALGALLYCMLTGQPPFRDQAKLKQIESSGEIENRLQQYRRLIDESPTPTAHRKVPGVDRSLAEIIDRCIARNPKDRFASVESVLQALRQRDLTHARRPLIILGILGPLLLLIVTSLFAWNAYQGAVSQSDESITRKALESNQWAARLAARSAAEQIDKYFQAVNQLAEDDELKRTFAEYVNDPEIREIITQLADPHRNADPALEPIRDALDQPINERHKQLHEKLQAILLEKLNEPTYPTAASWFLCDHTGTQIASQFNWEDPAPTIGRNYSYRSYFTGRVRDAQEDKDGVVSFDVSPVINNRERISGPNMSAIFQSKATTTWKIAFSTPIMIDGEFAGIAAVTADMGSLIEFQNSNNQYVMLVDGRPGDYRGTVLEHPLLQQLKADDQEITDSVSRRRVDDSVLAQFDLNNHDIRSFPDPMAQDELGEDWNRRWIASWVDVKRKSGKFDRDATPQPTGLKVIAVENYDEALRSSHELGQRLARTGTFALLFFLLVSGGLLFIVYHSVRKSRERATRILNSLGESMTFHEMTTFLSPSGNPETKRTPKS